MIRRLAVLLLVGAVVFAVGCSKKESPSSPGYDLTGSRVQANGGDMERLFNKAGNILISDQFNNRVVEITPAGDIVWSFGLGPNDFSAKSVIGCNDAQRVGPLTLMAGTGTPPGVIPQAPNGAVDNRVILVNPQGHIVWQYGQFGMTGDGFDLLSTPVQCTWLPNGDVLITDQGNNRIIEVTRDKQIVWTYPGPATSSADSLNSPNSAELLANGHILIADENNNRAIEVTRDLVVVKEFTAGGTLGACAFASRLPNGNTLLTDAGNSRAVEVDPNDGFVWQYVSNTDPNSIAAPLPTRAIRLRNGNTLISDQFNNRVILVNMAGTLLMSYGLPLAGGGAIGNNVGYDLTTVMKGLYSPYDATVNGDYTGLTPPRGGDMDDDDGDEDEGHEGDHHEGDRGDGHGDNHGNGHGDRD